MEQLIEKAREQFMPKQAMFANKVSLLGYVYDTEEFFIAENTACHASMQRPPTGGWDCMDDDYEPEDDDYEEDEYDRDEDDYEEEEEYL
jgi:hypothetical protein